MLVFNWVLKHRVQIDREDGDHFRFFFFFCNNEETGRKITRRCLLSLEHTLKQGDESGRID